MPFNIPNVPNLPVRLGLETIALYPAERLVDALCHVLAAVKCDEKSAARNEIDQPPECRLDCIEIGIDIRMIELNMRQDQCGRKVVEELRSLVEKGGVVLVTLNDE